MTAGPVLSEPAAAALTVLRVAYPEWTVEVVIGMWTAERRRGSETRYLVARDADGLAEKLAAAEAEQLPEKFPLIP